jgi:two-component system, NtrC family, nitrogen regulation sensor histidine kinase NtrY
VSLTFRRRVFAWLVVVAAIPAGVGIGLAILAPRIAAPVGGVEAWDRAGATWLDAEHALARQNLSPAARAALARHSAELSTSVSRAHQSVWIRNKAAAMLAGVAAALAALVALGTVRLAGHLSRQLSRPIDELIAWTGNLTRGEPLPDAPPARGAPEFDVLRLAFRRMASDLASARAREVEAAQLRAFRDLARQVAHELKNPLTPLRFASQRLAQDARPDQRELLDIITGESERIEQMARDFTTFGRLPEGPPAPVDLGELAETLARTTAPEGVTIRLERPPALPMISGHYEPLRRALSNLLLNAVDACEAGRADARSHGRGAAEAPGQITIALRAVADGAPGATEAVEVVITDNGAGIGPEHLARVFEPYFTTKARGTGLGLALVRQTIHDHGGTITVASEPGRGTAFTITLPRVRA